ncbi:hypothetical protein IKQ21_07420 [bacterium]|nr:hypothetical protein [bacterium]
MKVIFNTYLPAKSALKSHSVKKDSFVNFRSADLLSLSEEEIKKRVDSSIKTENYLGSGVESEVYKIPDTPYCVKVPKYKFGQDSTQQYSTNVTPEDKINHIRAKLNSGAVIMKHLEGDTIQKFYDSPAKRFVLQKKVAEMPVESYTDLLNQISDAMKKKMVFDCNPGNIIIDTSKNKLTAIDFFHVPNFEQIFIEPLYAMYLVLAGAGLNKKTALEIEKKVLLAGMKELEPETPTTVNLEHLGFAKLLENSHRFITKEGENARKILKDAIQNLVFLKSTNRFSKQLKEGYPIALRYISHLFK